jgi:pyruvate dehydrogenase E2 component (dihydrolipoamide acetyltransferase)
MHTIIEMPALSSTMREGTVVTWYKREGDPVKKGEALFEVETDKVNVDVESFVTGFLRKILIEKGIEVPIRTPIAIIADTLDEDISEVLGAEPSSPVPPAEEISEKAPARADRRAGRIKISPLAKRIAEEMGVDIRALRGSGPGGRITKKDVEAAAGDQSATPPPSIEPEGKRPISPEMGEYEDVPLTKMRKVVAERLQQSKMNIPHFYVDMTADATEIANLKTVLGARAEELGVKISYNDIIIKTVAKALTEFPMMNASFQKDRIRRYKQIHIGVAVAVEEGLVVPVLKDVDQKSISQISREAAEMAAKARNKKLLPNEYEGGTFTITNLGMFGVEAFHAIINPPECGILAVSAVVPKPVAKDEEITIRPCLTLSLAVDHRVIDGAMAARFLARVKEFVESPSLLLV